MVRDENYIGNIKCFDVSSVTNMSPPDIDNDNVFNKDFNEDINGWNVSHVTNMRGMFQNCSDFNQNLKDWNVSSVEDMSGMFLNCSYFNQDLSSWDVSSVTNMFLHCNIWNTSYNFKNAVRNWIKVGNIAKNNPIYEMREEVKIFNYLGIGQG